MPLKERLIDIITNDSEHVAVLQAVADLNLPDAWIAGGYIRNPVWDAIYETVEKTKGSDVDVVYFKPLDTYGMAEGELIERICKEEMNPVWEEENTARSKLEAANPELEFEVKNQARMYLSKARTVQHERYYSLKEAVAGWVESATAIGMRVNQEGEYEVLAPFGLEDLFAGIVRPTSSEYEVRAQERAKAKGWLVHWPQLRFEKALK